MKKQRLFKFLHIVSLVVALVCTGYFFVTLYRYLIISEQGDVRKAELSNVTSVDYRLRQLADSSDYLNNRAQLLHQRINETEFLALVNTQSEAYKVQLKGIRNNRVDEIFDRMQVSMEGSYPNLVRMLAAIEMVEYPIYIASVGMNEVTNDKVFAEVEFWVNYP